MCSLLRNGIVSYQGALYYAVWTNQMRSAVAAIKVYPGCTYVVDRQRRLEFLREKLGEIADKVYPLVAEIPYPLHFFRRGDFNWTGTSHVPIS